MNPKYPGRRAKRLFGASAVASLLLATFGAWAAETVLYVAPDGNDAWSGALPQANSEGTDGPLATLAGARDRIRAMKTAGPLSGGVTAQLRGGAYPVAEPVVFTPEDSGAVATPIRYEAYPGERPVLDGGRRITGWRQEGDRWVADIPEARDGTWRFGALWVNDERRQPARTPNAAHPAGDFPEESDYFYMDGPVVEKDPASGAETKSATMLRFRAGDVQRWASLEDAVFVVFHSWETSGLRVKSLDEAERIVEFTGPAAWPFGNWRADQWYYVEHLFEALDQPGEWFLNPKEGKLYYLPMPGEDMASAEVVAPVAKQLVLLEGKPADGQFVEHLAFSGIDMLHTEYTIEPQGHSDSQAASSVPAAFQATGARYCTLERCAVGHVGGYGVWWRAGCRNNRTFRCEIFDLGAGGVRIGECGDPASDNDVCAWNAVDNCFIHDGGIVFRGAVGVWIGRSSYNTLAHCEICDFRYTGISVGWSWGYAPSSANHNIIEYNHIHDIGKGQLNDMGGIYTLGISPGTTIRNNVFHDVFSNPKLYGGWGIYFDEGSTDILAENNLVYRTSTGTFHQHYGKENRVRNNIFAFSFGPQIIRSRQEEHISFFFERNIVLFNNGQLLGSNWGNGNYRLDSNCYWDISGDEIDFSGKTWDEWRASGQDLRACIADPKFANAAAGDFTLAPDSPALDFGFTPIDLSRVGLYGEPDWVDHPRRIPREPFALPPVPEPTKVSQNFEETPVGELPPGPYCSEGGASAASIRVAAETAASGSKSLKFCDQPGLQYAYDPHMFYTPYLRQGRAVGRFALRLEPGPVQFYHEWRDSKNPYRVGPSLWIDGAGDLRVQGQAIDRIPLGQWVGIEIACPLGKAATGTFDLAVTAQGQEAKRFPGLPCGSPEFRRLDWYGFVSNADAACTLYLDDIELATEKSA